jgi:hypothetical protein
VHDIRVIDAPCHLGQQPIMPDVVEESHHILPISATFRVQ